MCIKNLSYITETYLRYNVQMGNTGRKIHVSSISQIGPIIYVPDNDTEGEILGWTPYKIKEDL